MSSEIRKLGPVSIALSGGGSVFKEFQKELSSLPLSQAEKADVEFHFVPELGPLPPTIRVGKWQMADDYIRGPGHGYRFEMRHQGGRFVVQIAARGDETLGPLRRKYRQTWDWNFLTPAQTVAKTIIYDLFDVVVGALLVQKGATFLHASTCARGDEALALIAWGGVGKTTSVLKLVTEQNWRFMSDDLGLVDEEGTLWNNPKYLQIYAYNVAGQPALFKRLMEGRGPADRANWHWRLARFGDKKVRRRISATELFGPASVAQSAKLTQAIFLQRSHIQELTWEPMEAEELARQSATILLDELNILFELLVAAESHGLDLGLGTLEGLRQGSLKVLKKALQGVPTMRLKIPIHAGPDALSKALESRFSSST